jgi:heme/copper-type cytochrome/quinol oxidase subunit 2
VTTFPWGTLDPDLSAYASSVLGMVGFQWIVLAVLLVVTTIALLWALRRPDDPRGHTVVHNTILLAVFTGFTAAVVFLVVYVTPLLA